MRNWINIAPAVVFFAAYYAAQTFPAQTAAAAKFLYLEAAIADNSFYAATAALMAAVVVQTFVLLALRQRISAGEWAVAALILVFGGATLILRETIYLQIKTTVVNWLFAAGIGLSEKVLKRSAAEALAGKFFIASPLIWRRVSFALAAVFLFIGAVNLAVVAYVSEESWIWIKTFIYPAATFVGVTGIMIYVARHAELKNEAG